MELKWILGGSRRILGGSWEDLGRISGQSPISAATCLLVGAELSGLWKPWLKASLQAEAWTEEKLHATAPGEMRSRRRKGTDQRVDYKILRMELQALEWDLEGEVARCAGGETSEAVIQTEMEETPLMTGRAAHRWMRKHERAQRAQGAQWWRRVRRKREHLNK